VDARTVATVWEVSKWVVVAEAFVPFRPGMGAPASRGFFPLTSFVSNAVWAGRMMLMARRFPWPRFAGGVVCGRG
jgi:hypothetical protein